MTENGTDGPVRLRPQGGGRENHDRVQVTLYVGREYNERMRAISEETGRGKSDQMRELIEGGLDSDAASTNTARLRELHALVVAAVHTHRDAVLEAMRGLTPSTPTAVQAQGVAMATAGTRLSALIEAYAVMAGRPVEWVADWMWDAAGGPNPETNPEGAAAYAAKEAAAKEAARRPGVPRRRRQAERPA